MGALGAFVSDMHVPTSIFAPTVSETFPRHSDRMNSAYVTSYINQMGDVMPTSEDIETG
jgi:hypothetical protein